MKFKIGDRVRVKNIDFDKEKIILDNESRYKYIGKIFNVIAVESWGAMNVINLGIVPLFLEGWLKHTLEGKLDKILEE